MTPAELEAWGQAELAARSRDWKVVYDRAAGRATQAGLTMEQAAAAVREAIAEKQKQPGATR